MPACPACGASNPERFRFCGTCGAALGDSTTSSRQVRKIVTVLFVDVTGSTELGERVDPETMRRAMGRYFALVREVVERHGGTVEKFIGDAVMAVFGIPQVHEDDALRAVRAAAEVRDGIAGLNDRLRLEQGVEIAVRIALNTGEVVAGADDGTQTLITGDTVNTAARLEQAAEPGEILVGESTNRLVRGLATTEALDAKQLKGKATPVAAFRLLDVAPPTATAARDLQGPMVGRSDELAQLESTLRRVSGERRCHLFTVVGAAGVGKSRLIREFVARVGDAARVLRGRCLPYGDGITYWPIVEIVREAAGIGPTDTADEARAKLGALAAAATDGSRVADIIAAATGLGGQRVASDEIAWAVRKLLERLARERPLVAIIDDIQWAEPAMLDLIESVAEWSEGAPLLLLCMARPDLLDTRRAWSGGVLNATTVLLDPLPEAESATLIENLLGASVLDGSLGRRIVDAAEGNPLFVEEMIGMLIDGGILSRDGADGWRIVGEPQGVNVPPTIQAVIAARLDRLPADERAVAQRGSVIGRTFETDAVAELSPDAERPELDGHLRGLVRHQVIGPYQSDDVFRFRHLLIRDAAYEALPKEERAELHERFADWLESLAGDRVAEHEEILGYHIEQAHDYRRALGQRDEHVTMLAGRAGAHLASAGHRASDHRRDIGAALGLLRRAVRLLPEGHPAYWPARVDLGDALASASEPRAAAEILESVVNGPPDVADDDRARARIYLTWSRQSLERPTLAEARATIGAQLRSAVRKQIFDVASRAWGVMAGIYQDNLDVRHTVLAYRRAARYADRAGDRDMGIDYLVGMMGLASRDATPVAEVIALAERTLEDPALGRAQRLRCRDALSYLYALHGRFDDARQMSAAVMREHEDFGQVDSLMSAVLTNALIETFAEDYEAAAASFRRALEMTQRAGLRHWTSFLTGRLAHVLALAGREDEAMETVDRIPTDEPDSWVEMFVGGVRTRALARHGRSAEAVEQARRTVDDAARAGFEQYPAVFAPALEDLAHALASDGQTDEACAVLQRVVEIQRAKDNRAGLARAERLLAQLPAQPRQ